MCGEWEACKDSGKTSQQPQYLSGRGLYAYLSHIATYRDGSYSFCLTEKSTFRKGIQVGQFPIWSATVLWSPDIKRKLREERVANCPLSPSQVFSGCKVTSHAWSKECSSQTPRLASNNHSLKLLPDWHPCAISCNPHTACEGATQISPFPE